MESLCKNMLLMLMMLSAISPSIYANDGTLYYKCAWGSDVWQQLGLASKLEYNLRVTGNWGREWFVDFNGGKTQFGSFDH